jgi:hypothetical protein
LYVLAANFGLFVLLLLLGGAAVDAVVLNVGPGVTPFL